MLIPILIILCKETGFYRWYCGHGEIITRFEILKCIMEELCAADNTEDLVPCFSHHPQRTNEQWSPGNIDIV